jgi:hypothetical protein
VQSRILIFIYIAPVCPITTMRSIIYVGIITTLAINMATAGFGSSIAAAQMMPDNATTAGNMTGGNMTMGAGNITDGNYTEETGEVSGVGGSI